MSPPTPPHEPERPTATRQQKKAQSTPEQTKPTRPLAPTKAETALLPPFAGLTLEQIYTPKTSAQCQAAAEELFTAGITGFDTEAKPTFKAGEKSSGPHVVQFALTNKAFILQLHHKPCQELAAQIIASKEVLKVGFGLKNDSRQIRNRFGIEFTNILDLDQSFRKLGYRGQIGVRGAMGALLNLHFAKSKSTTTSNWAAKTLSPRQLRYAANDAFAALKVMEALQEQGQLDRGPRP